MREALGVGAQVEYAAEPKFDGLAISLRYEDGVLVQAATRGDGDDRRGRHRRTCAPSRAIPLRLQGDAADVLEVRGEVLMYRADFER